MTQGLGSKPSTNKGRNDATTMDQMNCLQCCIFSEELSMALPRVKSSSLSMHNDGEV